MIGYSDGGLIEDGAVFGFQSSKTLTLGINGIIGICLAQTEGFREMAKVIDNKRINSQPTMCLQCHLVVSMFHESDADPRQGSWECPNCEHKYPFAHWKIKKQTKGKNRAA
jgi:hypothetical protein